MSCWIHKEASGLWQWAREALFQELWGQGVFGLCGPLSPNFPQKCQTRTFRKLISNTWVRASFQTALGTEKRTDLDMHMTSAMGRHSLSLLVWDGGASQNLKLSVHTPGGFQENQEESLYLSEKLSPASNYQRLQGPSVLPQSSQHC